MSGTIAPVKITGIVIHAVVCPTCGVLFGLADHYEKLRREDGDSFYCPNGHALSYTAWLRLRGRGEGAQDVHAGRGAAEALGRRRAG